MVTPLFAALKSPGWSATIRSPGCNSQPVETNGRSGETAVVDVPAPVLVVTGATRVVVEETVAEVGESVGVEEGAPVHAAAARRSTAHPVESLRTSQAYSPLPRPA
jgi:hypothetical protein